MPQWNLMFWVAVLVAGWIGSGLGVLASDYFPGWEARTRYNWYPKTAAVAGALVGVLTAVLFRGFDSLISVPIAFVTAVIAAYFTSRLPGKNQVPETPADTQKISDDDEIKANEMYFKKNWNVRPRFETEEPGLFVGRTDFVDRLNSHFVSKSGGTILISGVRGVGKTALVDRALVMSRDKMQNRYWKETWKYLEQTRSRNAIDRKAWRLLLKNENHSSPATANYLTLKRAAERYSEKPPRWWQKIDPVDRRIRQWHKASRWQLLVLKFSASDISGALPEPEQLVTGKPRINPEKLLRSIIRKLYVTFDPSRAEEESEVLKWSLREKAKRQQFFETLNAAYRKSISKSYKEIISNTISDLLKQTRSSTWEGKMNVEKVGLILLCVAFGVVFSQYQPEVAWRPLVQLLGYGVPTAITGYILLSWGWKRTREKTTDQSRQSSFSYEYDYSLHQMRQDLESLVRILSPDRRADEPVEKPDPFRCFRRTILVFDELDKLEQADQQLDDIITHFKNFFTLSEAVFVFLTDHEFYEHLARETKRAQLARHYPPQHTFFTEKIYLRKPEFVSFREAFFKFTETAWIEERVGSLPADAMLMADLLAWDDKNVKLLPTLALETLGQLYVQRGQYKNELTEPIEKTFLARDGMSDAMAVAQLWASEAMRLGAEGDFAELREHFTKAGGWKNPQALSFLHYRREDLSKDDKQKIEDSFSDLKSDLTSQYESVDEAPFTLSDLARALCFQTRNHYFDLYNAIHDYATKYQDGAPVLLVEGGRHAHEPKLWSRYQQLLEIAFDSASEKHSSREYFNALLMESLYRAFQKGRAGTNVKIGDILFPPQDEIAATAKTLVEADPPETVAMTPLAEGKGESFQDTLIRLVKLASDKLAPSSTAPAQQNGAKPAVQPYTDADPEKINKAIIRLLRLALAHKAIREVTPGFRTRLHNTTDPALLADLEFTWNDNSASIIRSVIREQHEEDLINFWKLHGTELSALDTELGHLWSPIPIAGESAKIRAAIGELRTRADVVGIGQGTVSGPDAAALKANVGTWESREALWPRIILDRIRAEEDANLIEALDRPQNADAIALRAKQRRSEIEARIGGTVRAIVRPRNTNCAIYLVVGPATARGVDLVALKSVLPEKTSLFWFVTGKRVPVFTTPDQDGIYVYASPVSPWPQRKGAAVLIHDYISIASKERLETIITQLQASQFKDVQLVQRAGADLLGPIVSGSETDLILKDSTLGVISRLLKEKRERLTKMGFSEWTDFTTSWTAETISKRLASETGVKGSLTPERVALVEQALLDLFTDPKTITADVWLKTYLQATEAPNAAWLLLVKSQIKRLMQRKMDEAKITDQSLRSVIETQFVLWLTNNVQSATQNLNVETIDGSLLDDVVQELERQRKKLRSTPLPDVPAASANPPAGSRRRKKRTQDVA